MGVKFVVNGAVCRCNFAPVPDKLKVLTNTKEFANDAEGSQKAIASSMDIASTFEAGTFGPCSKQPFSPPCKSVIIEWSGYYEKVKLYNGGYPLLEDSKAMCPIGGKDCISIIYHGQQAEMTSQNIKNVDAEVHGQVNPFVDVEKLEMDEKSEIKLNS